MADEKKLDPFKPQQPSIPGVLPAAAKPDPETPPPEYPDAPPPKAALPMEWIAVAAAAALIILGGLFFWSRSSARQAKQPSADSAAVAPAPSSETPKPPGSLPLGPGPIATTDELEKPWSAKRFLFRDPLTSEDVPAIVVRLPRGEYWGFSLREPFGNCELEYVSDLEKLRTEYHYRAEHPMVGDPCNRTVYDLLRYGGGAADELVRGVIVQGNGIRPPMAIEIRTEGKNVIAVRSE